MRAGNITALPFPRRSSAPEISAAIKATARALVAPQLAEIFARTKQPFFQPIFDLEWPRMVFGRVALVGDAAFVARPHVGAGVTKAALDAASLAEATRGDDVAGGLLRFEREQLPFGSGLVALGRQEGAYLSAQLKPPSNAPRPSSTATLATFCSSHNTRSESLRHVLASARDDARSRVLVCSGLLTAGTKPSAGGVMGNFVYSRTIDGRMGALRSRRHRLQQPLLRVF